MSLFKRKMKGLLQVHTLLNLLSALAVASSQRRSLEQVGLGSRFYYYFCPSRNISPSEATSGLCVDRAGFPLLSAWAEPFVLPAGFHSRSTPSPPQLPNLLLFREGKVAATSTFLCPIALSKSSRLHSSHGVSRLQVVLLGSQTSGSGVWFVPQLLACRGHRGMNNAPWSSMQLLGFLSFC